jgi:tripartite-type tricarboxylate transporter receptor subunit TctC
MMGHMGTHGAAPALYPNLKYDPTKDFAPIGLAAGTPIVIVAKKDFPANDLKGFIEHMKKNGEKVNMAHAGVGSVSHITGILFNSTDQGQATMVAYRGTGPALNDLMANTVDFMTDQIVNVAPQIQGGNIKAFAIATPERSPALPNVPTTKEAGLPNYEVSAWNAVFAPRAPRQDVVKKLSDALDKALDDENTRKRLLDLGGVIPPRHGAHPGSPAEARGERSRPLDPGPQGRRRHGRVSRPKLERWKRRAKGPPFSLDRAPAPRQQAP